MCTFHKNFMIFVNMHINDVIKEAQPLFFSLILTRTGTSDPVNVIDDRLDKIGSRWKLF